MISELKNPAVQDTLIVENYYNLVRLHSHLDYVSPIEFEANAST